MVASSIIEEHYTIQLQVNIREQHNVPPKTQENNHTTSDPLYRSLSHRNELGYLDCYSAQARGSGWACVAG